jgi:hypothetical protein
MTTYNWSNLSGHDFELVCRDVMRALLGKHVESFAVGRDGGIDLRAGGGSSLVLGQAKHYARSRYDSLAREVKKEKAKLDVMERKPFRYLLFTSQPITPGQKDELAGILSPYCSDPSDILGVGDIEGIIADNPKIEEVHYKLWLSSIRVIERILGNATLTRSRIRVEELLNRSRLFVPHDAMPEAERILRSEKTLIVSGPPGIGKSTMAEMLSLRFLAADYSVHFVTGVTELEEAVREEQKQLFIYDDFLGRTNLGDAPGATDQERLFVFMRYLNRTPSKYLILTTREYLYREARGANERLVANRADVLRCLLDVDGYNPLNRAKILYNHLYWAHSLPPEAVTEFVNRRAYRKVIEHPNFNPRFIADTITRLAPPSLMSVEGEEDGLWI